MQGGVDGTDVARCVAVCAMRGVTSVEEGHDVELVTETMCAIRCELL